MKKIEIAGVVPNYSKTDAVDFSVKVIEKLSALGINPIVPDDFPLKTDTERLSYSEIYNKADCLIVLGGDGTILTHSQNAARSYTPILGINIGTIGFICEIEPSQLDILEKLSLGDYSIEKRYMFDVKVIRDGNVIARYSALNDAVISNNGLPKILEIEFLRNDRFVNNYRADGLIMSTPTGSTAYSLAAGGPIIDPDIELTCVTPVCPHTLTAKPMLFDMDSVLTARVAKCRDARPGLTVDGKSCMELCENDSVQVTKSTNVLELIKLKQTEFYDILYQKLAIKI